MIWNYQDTGFKTNRSLTFVETKTLFGKTTREFSNAAIIDVISVTRKPGRSLFLLPVIPLVWLGYAVSQATFISGGLAGVMVAGMGILPCLACYAIFRKKAVHELWIRPVNEPKVLAHRTSDWATAYECYRESYFAIMGVAAKLDPEDEALCIEILEARRAQATT